MDPSKFLCFHEFQARLANSALDPIPHIVKHALVDFVSCCIASPLHEVKVFDLLANGGTHGIEYIFLFPFSTINAFHVASKPLVTTVKHILWRRVVQRYLASSQGTQSRFNLFNLKGITKCCNCIYSIILVPKV